MTKLSKKRRILGVDMQMKSALCCYEDGVPSMQQAHIESVMEYAAPIVGVHKSGDEWVADQPNASLCYGHQVIYFWHLCMQFIRAGHVAPPDALRALHRFLFTYGAASEEHLTKN